jgi:WD40 repeat protein
LRGTLGEEDLHRYLLSLAFTPNGRFLASAQGKIKLWDVATGENTAKFEGDEGGISSVAFSPDGETLAAGVIKGEGTAVKLWDMTTGKQKAAFNGDPVSSIVFSPDGKVLASVSGVESIKLWDVRTGQNTLTLKAWGTRSVAFSRDGRTLASASMDATVKLWDLSSGKKTPLFEWVNGPWGTASSVAFSPDGMALAAGGATDLCSFAEGPGSISLWDLASRKEKTSFRSASMNIESVAFSPDGKTLATGSWDGKVQFWDTSTGKLKATVPGDSFSLQPVAFSPDGKLLATRGQRGCIALWAIPDDS